METRKNLEGVGLRYLFFLAHPTPRRLPYPILCIGTRKDVFPPCKRPWSPPICMDDAALSSAGMNPPPYLFFPSLTTPLGSKTHLERVNTRP